MWAHAEYFNLLRSTADGKIYDSIPEVAKRYLGKRNRRKQLEIWKPNRHVHFMRSSASLRVQGDMAFTLHWSDDNWQSVQDTQSNRNALQIDYADLSDSRASVGTSYRFTFFWTSENRWEGPGLHGGREITPPCRPVTKRPSRPSLLRFALLLFCVWQQWPAAAQKPSSLASASTATLECDKVVGNLIAMNLKRTRALHSYTLTEIYRLQYHGFFGSRSARMVVDVTYLAPATKTFTVRSTSGSKTLADEVFKRLIRAQREDQKEAVQKSSAMNRENYDFAMVRYESLPSDPAYVLSVKPRTKGRFLYSGQIWVSAADFAITRLKAVPAESPSFWTKHSAIDETYGKVGDFWMPAHTQSISSIRFGGKAELNIDYTNYKITSAEPVSESPKAGIQDRKRAGGFPDNCVPYARSTESGLHGFM